MKKTPRYVTKKQVKMFISHYLIYMNKAQLINEVGFVLSDLKEFPIDNKNQIKFYTRVLETIQ